MKWLGNPWQRVQAGDLINMTPEAVAEIRVYMETPADGTSRSRMGGVATKVEMWQNTEWFVQLSRDECCLCQSPRNAGVASGPDSTWPKMVWLSMRRKDRTRALDRDWRDMQSVKNDLVGPECEAVELYPAESRLVDTADQFHLWVIEDPEIKFPFGYLDREIADDNPRGSQRPRS